MTRQAGRALTIWLLAMLAGAIVVWNSHFSADMSFFLPAKPTAEQQVLVDQLKEGVVSRLLGIDMEEIGRAIGKQLKGKQKAIDLNRTAAQAGYDWADQHLPEQDRLKAVLREHAGAVLLAILLTWLLTAAVVVTLLMMPTLLQAMGIDRGAALAGNTLAICATIAANLVAGILADRFGAGRVLVLWSLLLGLAFWGFYASAMHGAYSPWAYALAGSAVGLTALVPAIAVGGFPAPVRFSGLSFSYNVAYAIAGGLTPVLLSLAMKDNPAAPMHYIAGMSVLGVALGAFVALRRADPGT